MKNYIIILIPTLIISCNFESTNQQSTSRSSTDYVEIVSQSKKEHGNEIFVYVEIQNTLNKTMKYVGAEITYYDSSCGILDSGVGTQMMLPRLPQQLLIGILITNPLLLSIKLGLIK